MYFLLFWFCTDERWLRCDLIGVLIYYYYIFLFARFVFIRRMNSRPISLEHVSVCRSWFVLVVFRVQVIQMFLAVQRLRFTVHIWLRGYPCCLLDFQLGGIFNLLIFNLGWILFPQNLWFSSEFAFIGIRLLGFPLDIFLNLKSYFDFFILRQLVEGHILLHLKFDTLWR